MCGIAGFYGRPAADASEEVIDLLAHRGPDGSGRYNSPCNTVSLFHTRLAIQDPTPNGAQPMTAADGQVVVTFNGEIYNFKDLRAGLQSRGYIFRSQTDTEVLLALYLESGTAMLEQLNGIYAFAIWDARTASLFLARDSFGVKPLYISETPDAFAFASEIKALLAFPWIPRKLDFQALALYVKYLWCPGPRTPLADIQKMEPGEALIVREGRIVRRWRHHTLPSPGEDASRSIEDWVVDIRQRLATAVERQMISDVPVGAFLSGGLDSSAVVAFARQHSIARLQCFTIDFDPELAKQEGFVRDLPYAERAARYLDVDLHVVKVGSEIACQLEQMVWQLDEPLADMAALNVLFISRLAREHGIKVLLSGAGGDDLFTGYRRHRAVGLDALWDRLSAPMRHIFAGTGRRLPTRAPFLRRLAKVLSAASLEGNERLVSYFEWEPDATVRKLFAPEIALSSEQPLLQALEDMPSTATPLQRMLLLEQRYFLTDHNLNYTDKMSMAEGVETRVPFLDPDVVSMASRIPDRFRQRGSQGKWILKQAMQGVLPKEVIDRPKTGFGVPLRAWLRGPLGSMMGDLLSPDSVRKRAIFDPSAVAQFLLENKQGRGADHSYSLLSLMCIELWCRQFLDASAIKLRTGGDAVRGSLMPGMVPGAKNHASLPFSK